MKSRKYYIAVLATLIAFFALLALAGCHHSIKPVVDPTPRLTAPNAVVKSESAAVHKELAPAIVSLNTAERLSATQPAIHEPVKDAILHVKLADGHATNIDKAAVAVDEAAVAVGKESVKAQQGENDAIEAYNKIYNSWPMKIWRGLKWLAVLWGAFLILAAVLKGPAATNPFVFVIYKGILAILSLGGTLVHDGIHMLSEAYNRWHATPGTNITTITGAKAATN